VELAQVNDDQLVELVRSAWRLIAPRKLTAMP
jgi:hypothetical protein